MFPRLLSGPSTEEDQPPPSRFRSDRLRGDTRTEQRWVRFLVGAWSDGGEGHLPGLPIVLHVFCGPGFNQQLFGLVDLILASLALVPNPRYSKALKLDCQGRRDIRPCGGVKMYHRDVGVQHKCHHAAGVRRIR